MCGPLLRFVSRNEFTDRGTEKCWIAMLESCFVAKAIDSTGQICCGVFFGVGKVSDDVSELGCVSLSYLSTLNDEALAGMAHDDGALVRDMTLAVERYIFAFQ